MRGKHYGKCWDRYHERITPAYAGKTSFCFGQRLVVEDHPRVCGENWFFQNDFPFYGGSPPRMRGKQYELFSDSAYVGITPAYAGKTLNDKGYIDFYQDHPRVCGENHSCVLLYYIRVGSPPRMRGKHFLNHLNNRHIGITPAYAGKTSSFLSLPSPWITPAYAGKTKRGRNPALSVRDHPRVCGENRFQVQSFSCKEGSPPRMRGKPHQVHVQSCGVGITPAYAGKTPKNNG